MPGTGSFAVPTRFWRWDTVEYPLYMDGTAIGTLRAEQDSLRLRLTASCPCQRGLWRAFAISDQDSLSLGVMAPEGQLMTAGKAFTLSSLGSFDPQGITMGCISQGSSPQGWSRVREPSSVFADPVLKATVAHLGELWAKPIQGGQLIAVPWQPGSVFPLAPAFALCRVQAINGRCFALLACDEKGWPMNS